MTDHFKRLENMFRSGAIHDLFPSFEFELKAGECEIRTTVNAQYHHAAGAMHGLVYFKSLDESGYFAAQSLEKEFFLLTKSAHIEFLRPVADGVLISKGRCKSSESRIYEAESELWSNDELVGKAKLILVRSKIPLNEKLGYR